MTSGMRFLRRGFLRRIIIIAGVLFSAYTVWVTLSLGSDVRHISAQKRSHPQEDTGCSDKVTKTSVSVSTIAYHGLNVSTYLNHTNVSKPTKSWNTLQNISVAYVKKWVGFPEISGSDCKRAINASNHKSKFNGIYPKSVARIFPAQYIADSENCSVFLDKYGWQRYPEVSEEERNFPIAYVILFYKDLDQVVFMLRAIYRPHNVYCLSLDTKANIEFLTAVRSVAKCLPNVFIASKLENIVYSGFTRLMADIDCMHELLDHPVQWKYVINLPGQQFPLRTNLELVRILTMYNGANDVEGITGNRMINHRFIMKHVYEKDNKTGDVQLKRTSTRNGPAPHKLEIVKGSAYGTFSRGFVQFVLHDQIAMDFLEWLKTVSSPDEYFWSTLHHSKILPVPGGFVGKPDAKPWLSTYASWGGRDPCATVHTRSVCIFSPEDLPQMMEKHELFANKFYITHHPAALHCLDEMLFNQTFSGETRDLSFYKNLPFALKPNTSSAGGGG